MRSAREHASVIRRDSLARDICDFRAEIWNHAATEPAQSDTRPNRRMSRIVTRGFVSVHALSDGENLVVSAPTLDSIASEAW